MINYSRKIILLMVMSFFIAACAPTLTPAAAVGTVPPAYSATVAGSAGEAPATTITLPQTLTPEDVGLVSPALEQYMQNTLQADLWARPELSPRDRSIVTVAALIARDQVIDMPYHFELALDNGVTPGELSEIITHLAFYSGWPNAMSGVAVAQAIFAQRSIETDQLPVAAPELLPLNEEAEAQRAAIVGQTVGPISPGLDQYTTELLFRDLWLRPDLAPRDRSLATFSALAASGHVDQISFHLSRAMDNGLTQAEAGEVLTQLAFYAGWPNAFSAVPIVQGVFESRAD
ncbi:MAG: carboxymuconolactone decarboxylase family protein [Caldilineaceae bacterium]|nr:carboxymuconolactone decarboxylase family protein [Caldilineaceae bacterium]